jgi:hypothetical protein
MNGVYDYGKTCKGKDFKMGMGSRAAADCRADPRKLLRRVCRAWRLEHYCRGDRVDHPNPLRRKLIIRHASAASRRVILHISSAAGTPVYTVLAAGSCDRAGYVRNVYPAPAQV